MEYDEEPDTDDDAFINDDEESCDGDDDLNNGTLNNPSSNLNDSMRTLSVNEIIFISETRSPKVLASQNAQTLIASQNAQTVIASQNAQPVLASQNRSHIFTSSLGDTNNSNAQSNLQNNNLFFVPYQPRPTNNVAQPMRLPQPSSLLKNTNKSKPEVNSNLSAGTSKFSSNELAILRMRHKFDEMVESQKQMMSIIQNSNTFTQPKLNDQTKQSANKESNNNSKMNLFHNIFRAKLASCYSYEAIISHPIEYFKKETPQVFEGILRIS